MRPGHGADIGGALADDADPEALRARAAGLMRDGRMGDAAAVLAQGRRRFPDDAHLLLDQATLAEAMDDPDGALELVDAAIDRHPGLEAAYRRASALCRRLDRPRDAEAILSEGICWCPASPDLLAEHAAIAEERGDWPQAARRYRLARERFPSDVWTHARLAAALRKAGRPLEAEQALLQGQRHVPHDEHFPVERAEVAAERGDWAEAARRFDAARVQFPGNWWRCKRHADILHRAGRIADAEAVLLEGQRQHPDAATLFVDHAELAYERRDRDEALRRYQIARGGFPGEWLPHKRVADILRARGRPREAEAVLLDGQQHAPGEPALFGDHAELAFDRRDWAEAARRFGIARDRFPDLSWPSKRLADSLRADNRPVEAEAALLEAQRRAPNEAASFVDHAELAFDRRDWAEGLRRFEVVRDRFPDLPWPHRRIADALRAAGRPDEAEAALLDAQRRVPDEAGLFLDHARLAMDRRDWTEARRRFEVARDRFPDLWRPLSGIAETYCKVDRFDDADRIMRDGIERFPDDPEPWFEHAGLAQWLSQNEEAVRRYDLIRQRFPNDYWGHFRHACAFAACMRYEGAEVMLIEVMRAFPDERNTLTEIVKVTIQIPADRRRLSVAALGDMVDGWMARVGDAEDLLLAKAQLAQIGGDYAAYLRWLLRVAEVNPRAELIDRRIVEARELLLGRGELSPEEIAQAAAVPSGRDGTLQARQELLSLFESLGGGDPGGGFYGCEFGFVQREVALEPLGMLRWAGIELSNVTRLLVNDFAGVGEDANCVLEFIDGRYDWNFIDTFYGMRCDHTHLDRLTVPQAEAIRMMCQRTKFLARKLREDLEDAEKVFVYRYLGPMPDEAQVLALARAVNAFGPNMLLFVCRADERHPPFTVRAVHPGLMVGHLDWFAPDRHHRPVNIEGWTRVCTEARRIWQDQATAV